MLPLVKAALEAIKEEKTLIEQQNKEFDVSPSKITAWGPQFLANDSDAFASPTSRDKEFSHLKTKKDRLMKKVGELTIEYDFFASACENEKDRCMQLYLDKKHYLKNMIKSIKLKLISNGHVR